MKYNGTMNLNLQYGSTSLHIYTDPPQYIFTNEPIDTMDVQFWNYF